MQIACNYAATDSLKVMGRSVAGTTDDMKAIGLRLRAVRYALGYDGRRASAFCRWLGMSPSQWHQYENGGKRIRIDEAIQVSTMTGATLDWIYKGDEWFWTLPGNLSSTIPAAREQIELEERERAIREEADRNAGLAAGKKAN